MFSTKWKINLKTDEYFFSRHNAPKSLKVVAFKKWTFSGFLWRETDFFWYRWSFEVDLLCCHVHEVIIVVAVIYHNHTGQNYNTLIMCRNVMVILNCSFSRLEWLYSNEFKNKSWCTSLNLLLIFSNPFKITYICKSWNIYIHSH